MGRTKFRPQRLTASPGWKAQTFNQSEMALFSEPMPSCAPKELDAADIVRDGDITTVIIQSRSERPCVGLLVTPGRLLN
jgi:hypothetical protein